MEKNLNKNKIFSLKLSTFNIGILLGLEKGNYIINKNRSFDPLLNLPKDIEEIKNFLKSNPQDILYFLYFNMGNIERILYNKDEIIFFDFDDKNNKYFLEINQEKIEINNKNEISFLFYMSLLIKYNKNITNFSFSFGLINKINSINNSTDKSNIYKKLLISKIILELINYYKSNQIFEEKFNKEEKENLNKIEDNNNKIIESNIDYFVDIGLKIAQKELKLENIDLVYSKIINILLKSGNFDLTYKIINQLDLESIYITKEMFNAISKTLFSTENYINEYNLTTFEDLLISKKVDFYYILFKYILKNSIYIYYIDFLNEIRKTIIKMKRNYLLNIALKKIDNIFNDKAIYIIKFLTNSNYYYEKYIGLNDSILNSDLNINNETEKSIYLPLENSSYENEIQNSHRGGSMFNLKIESSQPIEELNQNSTNNEQLNNSLFSAPTYLGQQNQSINEFKLVHPMGIGNILDTKNDKEEKINFEKYREVIKNILKESTITFTIKTNESTYGEMDFNESYILYKDFIKLYSEIKEQKFNAESDNTIFENHKKLINFLDKIKEIASKIFSENNLGKETLLIKIKLKEDSNQNNNKDIQRINSIYIYNNQLFEISNQDNNILNNDNYEGFRSFLEKIKYYTIISTSITNNSDINSMMILIGLINKYSFISLIKVIGKHKKNAEKIRELGDGSYLSDGYNEIFKYNMNFNIIERYNLENYFSFFIDNNEVIVIQKNKINTLDKVKDTNSSNEIQYSYRNLFSLKDNNYIVLGENDIYYITNIFSGNFIVNNNYPLNIGKEYRGGIKINEDIIAITSNRILPKGENKLIFFSSSTKGFLSVFEVEGYSFTLSENNCALMKIPKQEQNKILLVACKKYIKKDKNGILLLILKLKGDNKKFPKFYDTKNFEVYCFCPLLEIENKYILKKNDKDQIKDTEYFLVGGFDLDKNEGLIKLYKVIYDDDIENIKIEYIHDIILGKSIGILKNDTKLEDKENNVKKDYKSIKGFKDSRELVSISSFEKKELEYFKGFKGPISCIIQSSTKGLLITCYDGNVYLFSDPKIISLHDEFYDNLLK